MYRGRINGRGDVHELQARLAGRQGELPHIPHQREAGIVDGDGQVGLIVERGRHRFIGWTCWGPVLRLCENRAMENRQSE